MARQAVTIRGHSIGNTIPSSTPKYQGPNFGVTGWTVTHGRVWWGWHRSPQVISPTTVPAWGGTLALGLFETGTTILGPESSPNAPQWVHWAPVADVDITARTVWYDAGGTPASREWDFPGAYVEWKTQRDAPGNGMDLWLCWDIPSTPAGTDRFSWAWVIQYLEL